MKVTVVVRRSDQVLPVGLVEVAFEPSFIELPTINCEVCKVVRAEVYCAADRAHLCRACDESHHATLVLSKHKRVPVEQSPSQFGKCSDHPMELLECVCIDCLLLLCSHCVLLGSHAAKEHKGHRLISTVECFKEAMMRSSPPDVVAREMGVVLANKLESRHQELTDVYCNFDQLQHSLNTILQGCYRSIDAIQKRRVGYLQALRRQLLSQLLAIEWFESHLAHARLALPPGEFLLARDRHVLLVRTLFENACVELRNVPPWMLEHINIEGNVDIALATKSTQWEPDTKQLPLQDCAGPLSKASEVHYPRGTVSSSSDAVNAGVLVTRLRQGSRPWANALRFIEECSVDDRLDSVTNILLLCGYCNDGSDQSFLHASVEDDMQPQSRLNARSVLGEVLGGLLPLLDGELLFLQPLLAEMLDCNGEELNRASVLDRRELFQSLERFIQKLVRTAVALPKAVLALMHSIRESAQANISWEVTLGVVASCMLTKIVVPTMMNVAKRSFAYADLPEFVSWYVRWMQKIAHFGTVEGKLAHGEADEQFARAMSATMRQYAAHILSVSAPNKNQAVLRVSWNLGASARSQFLRILNGNLSPMARVLLDEDSDRKGWWKQAPELAQLS